MTTLPFILLALLCTTSLFAQSQKSDPAPKPFILGEIREVKSAVLGETRTLNVYLPDTYRSGDTTRFPVIYLLDGSADEDFIHIAGLVHYNSFEWVNRAPKSIVIGIATVDRRRDYTFPTGIVEDQQKFPTAGKSARFVEFIEKELQPFVEKTYRTTASKTIIGQSLGGLFVTDVLLSRPGLFTTYIIVSPSLWWNNGSLLEKTPAAALEKGKTPVSVFIAVGREGLTPTKIPRVMEVDAQLLEEKLRKLKNNQLRVFFSYLPDENHATIFHRAVDEAFRTLYEK